MGLGVGYYARNAIRGKAGLSSLFSIGHFKIVNQTLLAPMAGVTDLPFRKICREMGAGLVVSEMVAADPKCWRTRKSNLRTRFDEEPAPRSVQIVGYDPKAMADAAKYNVDRGAEIIDINMGCPAKKVCRRDAGSALLREPKLVEKILTEVTKTVSGPVTLKIRTGWDPMSRNTALIAKIAENSGISALAIHGRTRQCRFSGKAEYESISLAVSTVKIPVIANGDIETPRQASDVLKKTGAAAVMIGRAALGKPWIFRDFENSLPNGTPSHRLLQSEKNEIINRHLRAIHGFYGETQGVRIARKHVGWYLREIPSGRGFTRHFNSLDAARSQIDALTEFFKDNESFRDRAA